MSFTFPKTEEAAFRGNTDSSHRLHYVQGDAQQEHLRSIQHNCVRLFIQIPCFNEIGTIEDTISDIPKTIEGVVVSIVVVDDGSTDQTGALAKQAGADVVVVHKSNKGLASAFRSGLETCLMLGANVIVNLDGDNQYNAKDIPRLIAPILRGNADIVVGDRRPALNPEFSWIKRRLQQFGSAVISSIIRQPTPDAVSGFRAFTRDAAIKLSVQSSFSYTIETLLLAKVKQLSVEWVIIRTNPVQRRSRLARSIPEFIIRSGCVVLRAYFRHYPLQVFFALGFTFLTIGTIPVARFLWLYASGYGDGMVQSLVLGSAFAIVGFLMFFCGIVSDLVASNRQLTEAVLEKVKRAELGS